MADALKRAGEQNDRLRLEMEEKQRKKLMNTNVNLNVGLYKKHLMMTWIKVKRGWICSQGTNVNKEINTKGRGKKAGSIVKGKKCDAGAALERDRRMKKPN